MACRDNKATCWKVQGSVSTGIPMQPAQQPWMWHTLRRDTGDSSPQGRIHILHCPAWCKYINNISKMPGSGVTLWDTISCGYKKALVHCPCLQTRLQFSLAWRQNIRGRLCALLPCQRLSLNQLDWGLRFHCIVSPGVKLRKFCLIFPIFRAFPQMPGICFLHSAT